MIDSENLVDAIYIPLPSALHKDWVDKALEAGKHVLLEKPVALSTADFESMVKTAHRCGKLLMDGTMFVHTNRLGRLLEYCRNGEKVGNIQRIEAAFSFMGTEDQPDFFETNVRCRKEADPLGCIGDLGWYCVYMALLVFYATDSARPVKVRAVDFKCTEDGVPIDASCIVYFEKVCVVPSCFKILSQYHQYLIPLHNAQQDLVLSFYCSFQSILRQDITIVGTKKSISLDDFVLPTASPLSFTSKSLSEYGRFRTFQRDVDTVLVKEEDYQQVLMWKDFARLSHGVASGKDDMSWQGETAIEAEEYIQASLWNQRVMDGLLASVRGEGMPVQISR